MNTHIFLYPETSFFEVNLVAYFMKTKGNVSIVTERDNKVICTNEGIKILSDIFIDEIRIEDIDAFVICGGRNIVKNALDLNNDSETTYVTNKIILSPGNEYVDFALEIGKAADIFEDEDDYNETINYFKLFKCVE